MKMTITQIADAAGAKVLAAPCSADEVLTSFTWDSRTVTPGALYVAFRGERVDGHEYVADAVMAGARAALVTRDPGEAHVRAATEAGAAVLLVDDCTLALARIAGAWRERLEGRVVGITGSTGKTTTKNLVRDVLAAAGSVVATEANQNNEIGVPRTLLASDEDTGSVVVEMGMRGMGQIDELCAFAKPDWGLVTNAGEAHIELLGSRLNIARAKAELFANLPEGGIAFVNRADDYAEEMCRFARLQERGVHAVFFDGRDDGLAEGDRAVSPHPCVWTTGVSLDGEGRPAFTMNARGFDALGLPEADGACACSLELRGLHNVSNACSAAAIGLAAGMSLAQCCAALGASQPEKGRQQVLHSAGGVTVVDDSYNANPDSMNASLATFAAMDVSGRRIAVLGDMLELGDHAADLHARVGAYAAAAGIDLLICVGELSEHMAGQAIDDGMDVASVLRCMTADQALAMLRPLLQPGDAVLVKASHSIGLEAIVEGLVA